VSPVVALDARTSASWLLRTLYCGMDKRAKLGTVAGARSWSVAEWNRRLWLWVIAQGRCARCSQFTLTVAGLVPVRFGDGTTVAICARCGREGGASRLRALYRDAKRGAGMIDDKSYPGASRPAVKPETIGYPKNTAAVLTIADVDPEVEIPDGDSSRKVLTLIFKEFPDSTFYTNKTSRENLIKQFGLDERKWINERVPLVVVTTKNPQTKKTQPSLWVADPEDWDGHLKSRRAPAPRSGKRK
jgi:hypothetical protein